MEKLLVVSQAAPTSSAAYGRVGRELSTHLAALQPGYEIELLGTHGQPALTHKIKETFDTNTHPYAPIQVEVTAHPYPWSYFDGIATNYIARNLGADTILYIGDAWAHARTILEGIEDGMPWYLHCPIDHFPLSTAEIALTKNIKGWAVPTKWGTTAVNQVENGLGYYVPHGVSKDLFSGLEGSTREEQRSNAIRALGWNDQLTRYLCVANNAGDRKHLPNLIRSWSVGNLENSEMVIWSYPTRDQINPEALDLVGAATSLGIKNIRFPDPYQVARGFPDEHLGLVYAASDVLMCVSKTEGFGIPIVEAQAIGIPAIVTEYYPFLEVSGAHPGELTVSVDAWELQQMLGNTWMPIPTLSGTVTAMKYFHEKQHSDSMKELARNRKAHAQKYTWSLAAQKLDAMFKAQSGAGM